MKSYLVLLVAIAATQVSLIHGFEGRVSFGTMMTPAEQLKFNYQVNIHTTGFGGGSLIAPDVVLTAAHVLGKNFKSAVLYMGSATRSRTWMEGGIPVTPDMVVIHENYTDPNFVATMHYDIALILLKEPVTLSKNVGVIPLASKNNFDCENKTAIAWISGHGSFGKSAAQLNLSDFELTQMRYARAQPYPLEECRLYYRGLNKEPTQLCSLTDKSKGFGGTCAGDSGGPYAFDNPNDPNGKRILCGIVSMGQDCEKAPSGFISVPYFVDNQWICENSKGRVGCGL